MLTKQNIIKTSHEVRQTITKLIVHLDGWAACVVVVRKPVAKQQKTQQK